jgi:hypothetical protein
MVITGIAIGIVLYVWIGIYQPIQQIKRASFKEKREWVKKLREY